MLIKVLHSLISKSMHEIHELFLLHSQFIPSDEVLNELDIEATVEPPRPPNAPKVTVFKFAHLVNYNYKKTNNFRWPCSLWI